MESGSLGLVRNPMIHIARWFSWFTLALVPALAGPERPLVKVLVVDGYGNHDWQRTTRLIRGVLGRQGGFSVAVSTVPAQTDDPSYQRWRPTFPQFDVVVQTCNDINRSGPLWPEPARKDFEAWVESGGGVFVFHSGNNAFAGWEAYDAMIGLGWRPRNHGTAIRLLPDDTLERIAPGSGRACSTMPVTFGVTLSAVSGLVS
jgi:hypothetical protein